MNSTNSYKDIIAFPYDKSNNRRRMSNGDRAAQFSPFAALSGYRELILETARTTQKKIEIDEQLREEINYKLSFIQTHPNCSFFVSVLHFIPDRRKQGGIYTKIHGDVSEVNTRDCLLIFVDGREVEFENIISFEIIKTTPVY